MLATFPHIIEDPNLPLEETGEEVMGTHPIPWDAPPEPQNQNESKEDFAIEDLVSLELLGEEDLSPKKRRKEKKNEEIGVFYTFNLPNGWISPPPLSSNYLNFFKPSPLPEEHRNLLLNLLEIPLDLQYDEHFLWNRSTNKKFLSCGFTQLEGGGKEILPIPALFLGILSGNVEIVNRMISLSVTTTSQRIILAQTDTEQRNGLLTVVHVATAFGDENLLWLVLKYLKTPYLLRGHLIHPLLLAMLTGRVELFKLIFLYCQRNWDGCENSPFTDIADITDHIIRLSGDPRFSMADIHLCLENCLHLAAKFGDEKLVLLLLSHGANVNSPDRYGRTPLMYALEGKMEPKERLLITRTLVTRGASIQSVSPFCNPPLILALKSGVEDVVLLLLREYPTTDIEMQDDEGRTPLFLAVEHKMESVAHHLLQMGCKVDVPSNKGETPLLMALRGGMIGMSQVLIANGANPNIPNNDGMTPFLFSVAHEIAVDWITTQDVNNQDEHGRTPLHYAAYHNNKQLVTRLIEGGANVNCVDLEGQTPLCFYLSEKGDEEEPVDIEMVELLVLLGTNIADGGEYLYFATIHSMESVVKYLVTRCGVDVNVEVDPWKTALHFVSKVEMAKLLVSLGADVNYGRQYSRSTPLHFAIRYSSEEVGEYLIENGADVSVEDKATWNSDDEEDTETINENLPGTTPLHLTAVERDTLRLMELCLSNGANLDQKDREGKTPIQMLAEQYENTEDDDWIEEILQKEELLLSHGASPRFSPAESSMQIPEIMAAICYGEDEDQVISLVESGIEIHVRIDGFTPLHLASKKGMKGVVAALAFRGANINDNENRMQLTPLQLAIENDHEPVAVLLVELGADIFQPYPLHNLSFATQRNMKRLVKLFIDLRILPLENVLNMVISSRGMEEIVQYILTMDEIAFEGDILQWLIYAVCYEWEGVTKFLVDKANEENLLSDQILETLARSERFRHLA